MAGIPLPDGRGSEFKLAIALLLEAVGFGLSTTTYVVITSVVGAAILVSSGYTVASLGESR